MSDSLSNYLKDHLAGAKFAIDLLEHLRDSHTNAPLGKFAGEMAAAIKEDRSVLDNLLSQIDSGGNVFKEASAWLAEKTARLKLRLGSDSGLSEFEALETLSIGILGKMKLWQALAQISNHDARVRGIDFEHLIARAQQQHDEVESQRLEAAKSVFGNPEATDAK